MKRFEQTTCSFVIKIWADVDDELHNKTWRGRITSIPDGAQHLFVDLEQLTGILAGYLHEMGLAVPLPPPTHPRAAASHSDIAHRG